MDISPRQLSNGEFILSEDYREIDPSTGMQKGYEVLPPEERAKGFVRPVRNVYIHLTCNTETKMGQSIAETYARNPKFYSGTFCAYCKAHFPLNQFVWKDNPDQQVGS